MTEPYGRPATELTDEELEHQGKRAHDTRNWVFLHGTAEQFARHTTRMLELESEYLHRHPKRTWQGRADEVRPVTGDPTLAFLQGIADAPSGRVHKLEAHQLAREVGLEPGVLAKLYTADPPLLVTEHQDRVITPAGRAHLAQHSASA